MDKDKSTGIREVFIKNGHLLRKVRLEEIFWIKSDGNYCAIHTKENRYVIKTSLTRFLDNLPDTQFIQVHRSYVVRISQVDQIDTQAGLIYIGEDELPLGRKFKELLLERITLI